MEFFCWAFTGLLILTILSFLKAVVGEPVRFIPGGESGGDATFVDAAMFLSDKD